MEDKLFKRGKFGFVGDRSLRMLLARARELERPGLGLVAWASLLPVLRRFVASQSDDVRPLQCRRPTSRSFRYSDSRIKLNAMIYEEL